MDCPKTESGEVAVACLPDDSLVEIFSHLHAKPLFRFKCVSKHWCGLIADRLRCQKFPQTLEGFFAGDAVENYGRFIGEQRPVPLVDPSFSFLTKLPEIDKIVLLDSCKGLVLFGQRRVEDGYDTLGYIVCNPATEEWVSVPSNPWYDEDYEDDDTLGTYLVFDPAISPHFHLIELKKGYLFDLQVVHSFSSATGYWSLHMEDVPEDTQVFMGACLFNGMLHVRAYQIHPENKQMILAVSWEGKPYRTLHWPENDRGVIVFLGQSQGHLYCLSGCKTEDFQMSELSIWVLEDYNAEKWVLRGNVSLSQLFKRTRGCSMVEWNVVCIHPDCGLVFFAEYLNHKLISYDMDMKEVLDTYSLCGYHRHIIPYVPYFAQSVALAKKH